MITWEDAHRRAAALAAQLHADLGLDLTRPVDVFDAVRRLGLILAFAPLQDVSGLYLPARPDAAAGILLHAGHPRTRQRYTAAHELGHHVFDHAVGVDGDLETALQRGDVALWSDEEKEAEAFGAWFLMPRRLIREGMRQLGLIQIRGPVDVYALSLWLGTSYTATARQLAATRLLDRPVAERWAHVPPRTIKVALAGELAPDDLRNDVWWLDEASHRHPIDVRAGDRIVLTLPEDVSTGFTWEFVSLPAGFGVLADSFDDPWEPQLTELAGGLAGDDTDDLAGGVAMRSFVIDVASSTADGVYHLALTKRRPWQPGATSAEFEVLIAVLPRLRGVQLPPDDLRLPA